MSAAAIDSRRYAKRLGKVLPRVIRTEAENERRIEQLEELDSRWDRLSREERELAEYFQVPVDLFL
jgi:hypothetical protein